MIELGKPSLTGKAGHKEKAADALSNIGTKDGRIGERAWKKRKRRKRINLQLLFTQISFNC